MKNPLLAILILSLSAIGICAFPPPYGSFLSTCEAAHVLPTGSMKPTFDENYVLFYKKLDFSSIEVGDVIIFKDTSDPKETFRVVHRVVRKSQPNGAVIYTKGDNNYREDMGFVTEANYIGTVVTWVHKKHLN